MKKTLIILLMLLSAGTFAQQTEVPEQIDKNIIKTDVTGLLLTTRYNLNASWERLMSKKASLQLDFYFDKYKDELGFSDFYTQLGASYRFYFNRNINQMKGFYVAPSVRLHWRHKVGVFNVSEDYDALYLSSGASLGYQWIIKKKWTLDLYTDWQINLIRPHKLNSSYGSLGIKFGYKF